MERIIRIEELRISEGFVFLKLTMKKSLIVSPTIVINKKDAPPELDYATVISTGPHITDIKEGDIVLGFQHGDVFKWNDEQYAIVPRMGIKFFIKPDNFKSKENDGKKRNLELEN